MKISILFLLLLSTAIVSPCMADLIDQTCNNTQLYDLCRSTLHSDPQTSSAADVTELASAAACLCLAKATDTLDHIKYLINRATDPDSEKSLAYCAELYIPVVKYSLPQAIEALCQGHYRFAQYGLADAHKQADACANKFNGTAVLDDINGEVQRVADVAAAVVGVLLKM